ncbi:MULTISPECIES: tetratricopeptide repeat protein [Gluconobacter]|uniref:Sel1 repeat family protein n=1 Tax=Gluconobacter cadivus TaxID=2728101 RepID=A0ABR9YSY4_9PROT|nr:MULTISPECIES: tetratricopeptide repeat protein [Gluconobacter]MBF0887286.1 sel1 repeat family protein [Gluconobacter cadivus]MBS1059355.1 sel1 repeat family protein [Gluconobacter sp. Dm-44]
MSFKSRLAALFSSKGKLDHAIRLTETGKAVQGFALLSRLAAAGDAEASFRVGRAYLDGIGVPPSLEEGARWIYQAAQAGHIEAAFVLATLYTVGLPEGFEIRPAQAGLDLSHVPSAGPRRPDFHLGLHWARIAAEAGSPDAQALLGYILTNGPDDLRDLSQARSWYDRSAAAGCSQGHLGVALSILDDARTGEALASAAQHLMEATKGGLGTAFDILGRMYESGSGVPRDLGKAATYFHEAAERNIVTAQARYGLMLLEGTGIRRHYGRAETWLKRAATNGDTQSAALLGDLCANGGDLPPNLVEAAKWYRLAAEQKHAGAARALGLLYLTGNGVHQDPDVAAHWFKIASESGDAHADADFGNLILAGASATPDEKQALHTRFEKAAEKGDLIGAYNLGVCYAEGVTGEQNGREAARWMQKAADGVVNAQYWYGRMLLEGRDVQPDPTQALYWMEKAADAGMAEAQVMVAGLLVDGNINGRRDHEKALTLYRRAAESGNVDAMFSLAALYGGGHDVPENRPQAQIWFRKAAQRGNGLAQMMLGRYLCRGLAGVTDPVEGRIWLERAKAQNIKDAEAELALLDEAQPDDDD